MGSKQKIFQDSTQGYIAIGSDFVNEFIDTMEMQRLKSVCQMGIRPIYSGATHDRFSHSMGVYNLGSEIYDAFEKNTLKEIEDQIEIKDRIGTLLKAYRPIYLIACLLHDLGHPAYSHSLEYLYGNDFINFDNTDEVTLDKKEIEHICNICIDKVNDNGLANNKHNKLYYKLLEKISQKEMHSDGKNFIGIKSNIGNEFNKAAQHEMMSAYQILTSEDLEKSICKVLGINVCKKSSDYLAFIARMIIGATYDVAMISDEDSRREYSLRNCVISMLNGKIDADGIDYLNRNAHFAGYATAKMDIPRLCSAFSSYYDQNANMFVPCIKKSALAAFDWFVHSRNYEPRWLYSHHKIVYFNDFLLKYIMKYVGQYMFAMTQEQWEQSLVEFLSNMNQSQFERLSIKNGLDFTVDITKLLDIFHRASTVNISSVCDNSNELKKYIKFVGKKLGAESFFGLQPMTIMNYSAVAYFYSVFNLIECKYDKDGDENNRCLFEEIRAFFYSVNGLMLRARNSFTTYILSPLCKTTLDLGEFGKRSFYKSTDSDIDSLIKQFYLYFNDGQHKSLSEHVFIHGSKEVKEKCHEFFIELLNEFITRKYRQTLLKSHEEFVLFIRRVRKLLGGNGAATDEYIERALYELITLGGECIEFENEVRTDKYNSRDFNSFIDREAAYIKPQNSDDGKFDNYQKAFLNTFDMFDGLVIVIHKCSFKNYNDVNIRFGSSLEKYEPYNVNTNYDTYYLPFIFYKNGSENSDGERERLTDVLAFNLAEYITKKNLGVVNKMNAHSSFTSGKMIRDSVHGNIFVPQKFMAVVDCPAFQRLRDIKQLATADRIYPEATHTRFAHSLGVFHITSMILERLEKLFAALKLAVNSDDKDKLLLAALLHDIGHGPYSHVFEDIYSGSISNGFGHEKMTCEIIRHDPALSDAINLNFGCNFNNEVADIIEYHMTSSKPRKSSNLLINVYQDLISSNLDADRMDYMMRDSFNTGEKFGVFDLQRLISAMELTEYEGKIRVAIRYDCLSSIEQFIMGRYNMYANVYYAPYKLFTEELIKRICKKIIVKNDSKYKLHSVRNIGGKAQAVTEYLKLNDSSFLEHVKNDVAMYADDDFNKLKSVNRRLTDQQKSLCEPIVTMLDGFLYRDKYVRLRIDDYDKFIDVFKSVVRDFIQQRLSSHKAEAAKFDLTDSMIHGDRMFNAYNSKNEILIIANNGVVEKFSDCSKLFANGKNVDETWIDVSSYTYFNFDVCKQEIRNFLYKYSIDVAEEDFEWLRERLIKIIKEHDMNSNMEIENKYFCDKTHIDKLFEMLNTAFKNNNTVDGLFVLSQTDINHEDVYYDTDDLKLYKKGMSLRCRYNQANKTYVFTVKRSGSADNAKNNAQFVRNENEWDSNSNNLSSVDAIFLTKYLFDFLRDESVGGQKVTLQDLKPVVKIANERKMFTLNEDAKTDGMFGCEVCLDTVSYTAYIAGDKRCTIESAVDYQVEVELKCHYSYRVRLSEFSKFLCAEANLDCDKASAAENNISKYQKALKTLGFVRK